MIYYLKVTRRNTDDLVGYLVDLTPRGVMIMAEKPIEPGTVMQLQVLLQTDMSNREYLHFDAKSIWCEKSPSGISYDIGFELLNISLDDLRGIEQIIEEIGFND